MPADAAKHSSFLAICVLWHTSHKDEGNISMKKTCWEGCSNASFVPHLYMPNCLLGAQSPTSVKWLLPNVADRFEIEKSLTFRWQGLP